MQVQVREQRFELGKIVYSLFTSEVGGGMRQFNTNERTRRSISVKVTLDKFIICLFKILFSIPNLFDARELIRLIFGLDTLFKLQMIRCYIGQETKRIIEI